MRAAGAGRGTDDTASNASAAVRAAHLQRARPGPGIGRAIHSPYGGVNTTGRRPRGADLPLPPRGPLLRPDASDHSLALECGERLGRQAEELAVDLVVVLSEARRTAPDAARRAREARVDPLHAHGTDDRVVHRDDVPTGRDVRVGEDVGGRVSDPEGHLVPLEDLRELARRVLPAPAGDDRVDRL